MSQPDLSNMSPEEILELQKKNCIFCKIISKEIPSNEIYSDEKVLVILDINPANEGHCLILPKNHYQILPQLPPELIEHMFNVGKKLSRSVLKALGVKGTTFFVANGAIAGQKAPHFMIHIIPRKPGDTLFNVPKNVFEDKDLEDTRQKLQGKLGGADQPQVTQEVAKTDEKVPEEQKVDVEETKQVVQEEVQDQIVQEESQDQIIQNEPQNQSTEEDINLEDALGLLSDKDSENEDDKEDSNDAESVEEIQSLDEQESTDPKEEIEENEPKTQAESKDPDIDDIANLFLG